MAIFYIILLGIFFRAYKLIERYQYGHDADLFSWIAKDIIVDHHYRLIGQLTSAPGIFIGPLYYYLNIPFFLLTNMDPIGAVIPITIIGVFTIFSYYWIFKKLFGYQTGLIASFLYACSNYIIEFDRWVVPSTPTNLWAIWYFFIIISLVRGNFKVLPILGILIGLIWHIHIALLPTLIAIPVAIILSKKLPNKKQIMYFFIAFFVTSIPLIIFELRHNFGQLFSLIANFTTQHPGQTGISKLIQVLSMINKNLNALIFSPNSFYIFEHIWFVVSILILGFLLVKKKLVNTREMLVLQIWFLGIVAFFTLSSAPVSEYYFSNLSVIFIFIVSGLATIIWNSSKIGKAVIIFLLGIFMIKGLYATIYMDYYNKGYLERKGVAQFIVQDSKQKDYPCVGITYITAPGENVGFRYFFWLFNLKTVRPQINSAPVYNIVIPDELALPEIDKKFGHIGVIIPKKVGTKEEITKACAGENTNLTDPMFGFVN